MYIVASAVSTQIYNYDRSMLDTLFAPIQVKAIAKFVEELGLNMNLCMQFIHSDYSSTLIS